MEKFSGRSGEGVDRNVTGNDHRDGIENGTVHVLGSREDHFLQIILLAFAQTQFAVNVFNHDQRAVDDDSEVDCADGEQICNHTVGVQKNEGEKQRERNRQRYDHCGTKAYQEKNQHDQDQSHAQQQIVFDRADGEAYQVAAVVERSNFYIRRKNMLVQFFGFFFHAFQDVLRLVAAEHHDDAFDRVIVLVESELPESRRVADHNVAHISNVHRHAILRADNHSADIRFIPDQSEPANVVKLLPLRIEAAARVCIVKAELLNHGRHCDVVAVEPCGIEQHLILHYSSAKSGVVRNSTHLLVLSLDHPVFERFQFLRRTVRTFQHVAIHKAGRAG